MNKARYISTRGEADDLSFEDVTLSGLARDGGLYVPRDWPTLSTETISGFVGRPFHDVATEVIAPFAAGSLTRDEVATLAHAAYARFGHPAVTPICQIAPNRFVLELFHGPTLAFKDVAMQFLAGLMDEFLKRRRRHATIICATSGDTGGAAVEAFRGAENVDVAVLFPKGRVSDVQRRMMTTPREQNVHALSIDGTFDDCQALVKAMFNDHAFRDEVALSGVNSINWARIVPQVTYYFAAAAALGAPHRKISFAVPTGNFGDIFAGYVAQRMGLPIDCLTIASNDNDILPRTIESGVYETRTVVATTSPSMDIQVSSNFERFLFEHQNRDASLVASQMASLAQSGRFEVHGGPARLQQAFRASASSQGSVAECITRTYNATGYLVEPHTACGILALDKQGDESCPQVVLATAHPAKFSETMQQISGAPVPLPARLAHLLTNEERMVQLANDVSVVKDYLRRHSRARLALA